MKKLIVILGISLLMLNGCGKQYICNHCGESFRGTAYTDMEYQSIMCEKCATRYWNPLPIKDHKYKD